MQPGQTGHVYYSSLAWLGQKGPGGNIDPCSSSPCPTPSATVSTIRHVLHVLSWRVLTPVGHQKLVSDKWWQIVVLLFFAFFSFFLFLFFLCVVKSSGDGGGGGGGGRERESWYFCNV